MLREDNSPQVFKIKMNGDLSLERLLKYFLFINKKIRYQGKSKILIDASKSNFLFEISHLQMIVDKNRETLRDDIFIIQAIITDIPKNVALAMLYKELSRNNNYKFDVFSTEEKALSWLNSY